MQFGRGYQYDKDSNRILEQQLGEAAWSDNGEQTYTYTARQQLKSWTNTAGTTTNYSYDPDGNRTAAGASTFSYDNQGRLTTGGGKSYVWSDRGTLTSVTAGATVTSLTYDAFGQELTSTTSAGTTTYTRDGLGRIASRNGTAFKYAGSSLDPISDGTWTTTQRVDGSPLATKNTTSSWWTTTDTHGDLVGLQTQAGPIDNTVSYDPYGVRTSTTMSSLTTGFQSDYTDPTTSEVCMGARSYRAEADTFTSRDTVNGAVEAPLSLNRYTYAHNNPIAMIDPDGHSAVSRDQQRIDFMSTVVDGINRDRWNQGVWFHQIAMNNHATEDQFATWWTAYQANVLDPAYNRLLVAALAWWESTHPESVDDSTPAAILVTNETPTPRKVVPSSPSTYLDLCKRKGQTDCVTEPVRKPWSDDKVEGAQIACVAALTDWFNLGQSLVRTYARCAAMVNAVNLGETESAYYAQLWVNADIIRQRDFEAVQNALRHAIVAALMSRAVGADLALAYGLGLESYEATPLAAWLNDYTGDGHCPANSTDTTVDVINNAIGVNIQLANPGATESQLVKRVVDRYASLAMVKPNGDQTCNGPVVTIGRRIY